MARHWDDATSASVEIDLATVRKDDRVDDPTERPVPASGQVSWLLGSRTNISTRDQLRHQQGAVLVVQVIRTPQEPGASILDRFGPGDVEVGISREAYDDVKAGTAWAPLDACSFDPAEGVLPPGYRETIERIAAHRTRVADTLAEAQKRAAQAEADRPAPSPGGSGARLPSKP